MARLLSTLATLCALVVASSSQVEKAYKKGTSYVIVGGGPAGLVLADRLSQSGTNQVTLLEAGPDTINTQSLQGEKLPFAAY